MAHDVFVSHSSKDKPTADAVCAMLESQGIRCWVAPRDIIPGMDWGEAIVEAVKGARVMVLVFSASANGSPQIKREVERAVNKGIPVIPLRIEDVAPTASLEYFISTPHWLDAFPPPLEGHLRYLAQIIHQVLAKGPTETAVGAAPALPGMTGKPDAQPARESRLAKTGGGRGVPTTVLAIGAVAVLAALLVGWWFGVEQPRRNETARLRDLLANNGKGSQAAVNLLPAVSNIGVVPIVNVPTAPSNEDKTISFPVTNVAAAVPPVLTSQPDLLPPKPTNEIATTSPKLTNDVIVSKPTNDVAIVPPEPTNSPVAAKPPNANAIVSPKPTNDFVVVPPPPTNKQPTIVDLIKDANLLVGAQSKEKVLCVYADKSSRELVPSTWHLVFYEPSKIFTKAIEVTFRPGQGGTVGPSGRLIEAVTASSKIFDKSRLKVDFEAALQIAATNRMVAGLTLKRSEMRVELRDGILTWDIKLWAAKIRNPRDEADIGKIFISAEDGNVLKMELHPRSAD